MEKFFGKPADEPFTDEFAGAYPADITKEDDSIVVDAELPGFKSEQVDVTYDSGLLRISAERKPEDTSGKEHLSERRFTRVERTFTLPAEVDATQVEGELNDGVLHLRLPKTNQPHVQQITVK